MKRKERKHLKEDEFVSTLTRVIQFTRKWQKELKIIALSLVAVLVIVAVVRAIQLQSNHRENKELARMLNLRSSIETKTASSQGEPSEIAQLEKMAGPGRFSRLAYLFLATYWVERGDFSRAQSLLEKFPPRPRDMFYFQARDLLGQVLTWRRDLDKAVALFEALEKEKSSSYPQEIILMHLAEALELKGDKIRAKEIYQQVQEQFPQSVYTWNLADRIRRLGG